MVKEMSPSLSTELNGIPYVSTATVSLAYSQSNIHRPLDGFGFIVPRISNRRIMAATFTSTKFNHRAPDDGCLIRVFVGGAANEDLVYQDDAEITEMVREELKDIVGIVADPLFARVFRWKKAMPQYIVGHMERLKRIEQATAHLPGLYLTGSAYKGIGISDCIVKSDEVAEKVVHFLSLSP
jgi:oxygen-dependent protoporphyrinogen oxidase